MRQSQVCFIKTDTLNIGYHQIKCIHFYETNVILLLGARIQIPMTIVWYRSLTVKLKILTCLDWMGNLMSIYSDL